MTPDELTIAISKITNMLADFDTYTKQQRSTVKRYVLQAIHLATLSGILTDELLELGYTLNERR